MERERRMEGKGRGRIGGKGNLDVAGEVDVALHEVDSIRGESCQ